MSPPAQRPRSGIISVSVPFRTISYHSTHNGLEGCRGDFSSPLISSHLGSTAGWRPEPWRIFEFCTILSHFFPFLVPGRLEDGPRWTRGQWTTLERDSRLRGVDAHVPRHNRAGGGNTDVHADTPNSPTQFCHGLIVGRHRRVGKGPTVSKKDFLQSKPGLAKYGGVMSSMAP